MITIGISSTRRELKTRHFTCIADAAKYAARKFGVTPALVDRETATKWINGKFWLLWCDGVPVHELFPGARYT